MIATGKMEWKGMSLHLMQVKEPVTSVKIRNSLKLPLKPVL
jgi:hypothetical protein